MHPTKYSKWHLNGPKPDLNTRSGRAVWKGGSEMGASRFQCLLLAAGSLSRIAQIISKTYFFVDVARRIQRIAEMLCSASLGHRRYRKRPCLAGGAPWQNTVFGECGLHADIMPECVAVRAWERAQPEHDGMHSQPCFAQGSRRLAQARLSTALGQIATYVSRASDSADAQGKPRRHWRKARKQQKSQNAAYVKTLLAEPIAGTACTAQRH